MKKQLLCLAVTLLTASLLAADAKEEVTVAAKKLGESANYSWKATVVVPESARFKPGPTDGQTEKDGFTVFKMNVFDNTLMAVKKGDKAVFTNQDGDWQTPAEAEGEQGRGRFAAAMVRNLKTPAAQATELADGIKEFKQAGDTITGDLTETAAKNLMSFRSGGNGPNISEAKGSAKFWVKDGALQKYEFKVTGKMEFNGNDFDVDRTTTVEIKEVGTTKVAVPEAAKKKLG